jgi:hypothetical protein
MEWRWTHERDRKREKEKEKEGKDESTKEIILPWISKDISR